MKCFTIFAVFLLSLNSWSKDTDLLKCLGNEEKRLHLNKTSGPIFDLNQRIIAEIIQIPHSKIRPECFHEICSGKKFSESMNLLEASMKYGKNLFVIPKAISGQQRGMTQGMIDDYIDSTKEIFLHFISQIQALSPTPTCLKEEIPQLQTFFDEIKYLQEDLDLKVIFKNREKAIFGKLKNYQRAFEKCRKGMTKKLKSGSTSRAKNS